MVPLAWLCPLLSGVADSGAIQNRCIYTVFKYWDHVIDHVTFRLHTGELYLTNNVTSEGSLLHQILCTHHVPGFYFFELFETFHFTNLDYFVMLQNMKNAKGMNTFGYKNSCTWEKNERWKQEWKTTLNWYLTLFMSEFTGVSLNDFKSMSLRLQWELD